MRKAPSGGHGLSAGDYVEVYDEPDHAALVDNAFVYAYRVCLPPDQATLWHRHTEDTVYFSLAAARGQEEMPDAAAVVTDIPCARAVSRAHRNDPLIHRVTNIGRERFHLIGAEAHARPEVADATVDQPGHELVMETARFRVYRVTLDAPARAYAASGLLVALADSEVSIGSERSTIAAADVRWLAPADAAAPGAGFDGFFALWR